MICGTDLILEIAKKYSDTKNFVHVNDERWQFVDLDKIYQEQKYILIFYKYIYYFF